MSLERTKGRLLTMLADPGNNVIALSGRWGTGKTHLWREVAAVSDDIGVKASLYVSLFGLSTVDQIKRKLIESAAPGVEAHPKIWETARQSVDAVVKALASFHKGFEALGELNLLLLAPAMLGKKVIVIDDIERKHERLGIDEVMGFIDEYTQRHGARFVLILNSDQLARKDMWDQLREKVIDEEVRLTTTPEETFAIANGLSPSRYEEAVKRASIVCGLTNIRIVGKVIRATNRILGDRDLPAPVLARVIPSIVLFSAIHYKGLIDGPDVLFALSVGSASDMVELARGRDQELTEEEARRTKWRMLMHELGIFGCDEFEALVVEFLESGLVDDAKISTTIERYLEETQQLDAREKASQFLKKEMWDHRTTEEELLAEATRLLDVAELLDPYVATQLHDVLADYPDGRQIGQEMIDRWIQAFLANPPRQVSAENPFDRPLHPAVKSVFDEINANAQEKITVVDVCMTIAEKRSWGAMEGAAMRHATASDFESAIRGMEIDSLPKFMRLMIEMSLQPEVYEPHFGTASKRFVEACRAIANDREAPRLVRLIRHLFKNTSLAAQLEVPVASTGSAAHGQHPIPEVPTNGENCS